MDEVAGLEDSFPVNSAAFDAFVVDVLVEVVGVVVVAVAVAAVAAAVVVVAAAVTVDSGLSKK